MEFLCRPLNEVIEVTLDIEGIRIMFVGDLHLSSVNPSYRIDNYSESLFNKLRYIEGVVEKEGIDLLLFSGDIFHRKRESESFLVEVIHLFREFKIPVYTILGNHDILYANVNTVERTPMGVLLSSGVVKRLGSISIMRGSVKEIGIVGMDYGLNPLFPECERSRSCDILVGHSFLQGRFSNIKEETISKEDVERSFWDVLLFGHDHVCYGVEEMGRSTCVRPGSLSRDTIHSQNRDREVYCSVVDVRFGEMLRNVSARMVEVPVKSYGEVFSALKVERKEDFSDKMSKFVKSLEDKSSDSTDLIKIVEQFCLESRIVGFIKDYLVKGGVI